MGRLGSLVAVSLILFSTLVGTPSRIASQTPPKRWLTGTGGFGASSGGNLYDGSFNAAARLGGGLQIAGRLGVEGTLELVDGGMFQGETSCVQVGPCRVNYGSYGASAGLAASIGPRRNRSLIRLTVGAGIYRVRDDQPTGQGVPTVSAIGINSGVSIVPKRWGWGETAIGLRGTMMPDVNGERLGMVFLELGFRVW